MLSNPSRLFIPSANPADPAFQWRLDLHWQEPSELSGQDHRRAFLGAANELQSGPLCHSTVASLLALSNDDAFQITEIDTAILTLAGWLQNLDKSDQQTRDLIFRHARIFLSKSGPVDDADIPLLLKLNAVMLVEDEIPRIRAKIAIQELAGSLLPDQLIPRLVEISPRYLQCQRVQAWIEQTQRIAWYSNEKEKRDAGSALARLAKAIQGDGRSRKTRQYAYWETVQHYKDLTQAITDLRAEHFQNNVSAIALNKFCEKWSISEDRQRMVLSYEIGQKPTEVAVNILMDKNMIGNKKAFQDLQTAACRMNRRRKHDFRVQTYLVEAFFDLPTRHPELIDRTDHWRLLESVTLKPTD